MHDQPLNLTDGGISQADVIEVARGSRRVVLTESAIEAITRSRNIVESMIDRDEPVYGITTGFGSLAHTFIESEQREALQQNLIRSHAAGMGEPVEVEVVRAMMLLRARTLAMGFSGTRLEVVKRHHLAKGKIDLGLIEDVKHDEVVALLLQRIHGRHHGAWLLIEIRDQRDHTAAPEDLCNFQKCLA